MLSLVHILEWRAAVHPESIALSDHQGTELTYAGLAAAMEQSAAQFAAAGVRPGDVVPIIARNQVGWMTAMFGLIRAGALPAAVSWRLAPPELAALLTLLAIPRARDQLRIVFANSDPKKLNLALFRAVQLHMEFGLLLIIAYLAAAALGRYSI